MSFLIAVPAELNATAVHLSGIGSAIREAGSSAAGSTAQILPAAEDEVSAAIAALFGSY
ncbi:PE family protein [Mycobacterium gordonae]